MAYEIERKFLVRNDDWRRSVVRQSSIRQAYLRSDDDASIRIRLREGSNATLTIKSKAVNLRRLELEYEIPMLEAEKLVGLRHGSVVEKIRHIVPHAGLTWEVDVFSGENQGLIIAEVELGSADQHVDMPAWVGREITADHRYYNGSLAHNPFTTWARGTENSRAGAA